MKRNPNAIKEGPSRTVFVIFNTAFLGILCLLCIRNMKTISVSIVGCGARGCEIYGSLMRESGNYAIVSLCDPNEGKLQKYGERFGVPACARFSSEESFFEHKRSDLVVIASQDRDHVRECLRALELGYDVLLEKPITDSEEECRALLNAQKKYGGKVIVCHVLRYAPAFVKLKELLNEGRIGDLVAIDATEQVAYWHQAHSYVRGNWRRREDTTPMILAKCCHDLDLLQYYAGSKCESVSSVGELAHFRRENQPKGAADRCNECAYVHSCPYSAVEIYLEGWKFNGSPENSWPYNILTTEVPLTEKNLREAIESGPYGRCVYACDNDVVDHQIVTMRFQNGVKATLKMLAFTADIGRIIRFYGTKGEIDFDESKEIIEVKPFDITHGGRERIEVGTLVSGGYGHGGGDGVLIQTLSRILSGESVAETDLEASIESHLMGIAAERSRLLGGTPVRLH